MQTTCWNYCFSSLPEYVIYIFYPSSSIAMWIEVLFNGDSTNNFPFFPFSFWPSWFDVESVFYLFRLRVAMLPLLLHLHQSQLDFLIDFFGEKSSPVNHSPGCHKELCDSKLLMTKSRNLAGHTIVEEALLPFFQASDVELESFIRWYMSSLFSLWATFLAYSIIRNLYVHLLFM